MIIHAIVEMSSNFEFCLIGDLLVTHNDSRHAPAHLSSRVCKQNRTAEVRIGTRGPFLSPETINWVSRSGIYRFQNGELGPDRDMDLRDAIRRIAVEWPSYARPRITQELRR